VGLYDGTPFILGVYVLENRSNYDMKIHNIFPAFHCDRVNIYPANFPGEFTLHPGDQFFLQVEGQVKSREKLLANPVISTSLVIVTDSPSRPIHVIQEGFYQFVETPSDIPPGQKLPDPAPDPPFLRAPASQAGWTLH